LATANPAPSTQCLRRRALPPLTHQPHIPPQQRRRLLPRAGRSAGGRTPRNSPARGSGWERPFSAAATPQRGSLRASARLARSTRAGILRRRRSLLTGSVEESEGHKLGFVLKLCKTQPLSRSLQTPGQGRLLPPSLLRFRNRRVRLRGRERSLVSGRKQKHSFPRASRAAARANTQPAAPPRGGRRPAPKRPDEHHRELTQDEARGSLGLAVPAPHICLLLRGDIWDDSNCRTTGKGILSGFYFLQCQGEPLLTVSFDAILAFLRREGEKGALAPGKVGSRVPAAPDDPSHDHHKVWPPGPITSALGSSASGTKREESKSGLPVPFPKILLVRATLGEGSSRQKAQTVLIAGGLWREKGDTDRQSRLPSLGNGEPDSQLREGLGDYFKQEPRNKEQMRSRTELRYLPETLVTETQPCTLEEMLDEEGQLRRGKFLAKKGLMEPCSKNNLRSKTKPANALTRQGQAPKQPSRNTLRWNLK